MKKHYFTTLIMLLAYFPGYSQDIPELPFITVNQSNFQNAGTEIYLTDSMYIYAFMGSNTDSTLMGKEYISYSDRGKILRDSSMFFFPDSNLWFNGNKNEFSYDIINRLEHRTEYIGSMLTNGWLLKDDYHHTYLNNSSLKSFTLLKHYNNAQQIWEKGDSTVYTYDDQENLEFDHLYHWDSDSNKYLIEQYRHYAYNSQGWCISDTLYYYVGSDSAITTFLRTYDYDNNGNEIRYRSYDGWGGVWVEMEKHEYEYNGFNHRISDHRYEWDQASSEWELIELGLFDYDDNQNMIRWRYFEKNDNTGEWDKETTMQLFWSLHTIVDIAEFDAKEPVRIWPNPTSGSLTIASPESTELKVFNLDGRLCMTRKIKEGLNSLNMDGLAPGMYILQCLEGRSTQKLLVR